MSDLPANFPEIMFRVLFPDHLLIRTNEFYATFCGGTLLVSDSVGTLSHYISELHDTDMELCELTEDSPELPRRTR